MTFALFNVIVAIFVENTLAAARSNDILQRRKRNHDEQRWMEKSVDLVQCIVVKIRSSIDSGDVFLAAADMTATKKEAGDDVLRTAADIAISKAFYKEMIKDDDFCERLRELDIANEDIPDLFDTFDADNSESLTVLELLKGIKKLRGDPRKSDVISISLQVQSMYEIVMEQQESVKALTWRVQEFESKLFATASV